MTARFSLKPADHLGSPNAKQQFNRQLFSEVAPRYDFITKALSFGRDKSWKRHLIRNLPERSTPVCVDLACGTGDLTRMLADHFPRGSVTGLDLTPAMLDLARKQTSNDRIEYIEGSMAALPFADGSVDVVTGGYALRNAPDLEQTLAEVFRVLRPGGVAAFLDFSKPRNPVGQALTHLALKFWGGCWGILLHGNPDIYGYIADSLKRYPDRTALQEQFIRQGFAPVSVRRLFGGLLENIRFEKEA